MKKLLLLFTVLPIFTFGQFDYYGPEPFGEILNNSYSNPGWTKTPIGSIENKKYVAILGLSTQKAIMLDPLDKPVVELNSVDSINGASATHGSMMRSLFQLVDENTHSENDAGGGSGTYTPLSGKYKLKPVLHSYFAVNDDRSGNVNSTDAGTFYIHEEANTGYLLVQFGETPSSTTIEAVGQWEYSIALDSVIENTSWTTKYLMTSGGNLSWTTNSGNATSYVLANANDLIDTELLAGSDFNPLSGAYEPNATAHFPTLDSLENSRLIANLPNDIDASYNSQLGSSASASAAATTILNTIESDLISNGDSLRYPKQFYLDLRENMLSHLTASKDIYNGRLNHNTVEHVYFINAEDDSGVPHPFMVIAAHATSTRPNFFLDVSRPPGATPGAGYAQSEVTRHGKLGEFLAKIPLKDYGLINTLLDNDLSPYGDLASDFDAVNGSTTVKDVYNYTSLASCGIAVDGVTIYPAYNNNLRFAVEDAEVTSSGIHVGGGLELHYHVDGHAFNGNGINLYNLNDYVGRDHPPVIGMAYDGIALFGKYEAAYSSMAVYNDALDAFGGHDHGDGFGYHYHAHTQNVTSSNGSTNFDEHFLMVGAWKGAIANIPGFEELKTNQLNDATYGRFAGASHSSVGIEEYNSENILIIPNPNAGIFTITTQEAFQVSIISISRQTIKELNIQAGKTPIVLEKLPRGVYFIKGSKAQNSFIKKVVIS